MGLSNTATPKYYGEFRAAVIRGDIPVCQEISDEMNRIDALIADPDVYYDEHAMDGFVEFVESELTLTDGGDVTMLFTFKLWAEQIFCWYYFEEVRTMLPGDAFTSPHEGTRLVKRRLVNKQYLIVSRGSAKSMYASFIHAYFLTVDTETTQQITTAPTMKLAEEVMSPIRTAIVRSRGPLFAFLTEGSVQNTTGNRAFRQKLSSTKKGVENFLTNSLLEVRPMTINKLQGLRTKINTIDEWLSGDTREDVIGAIEQGASKVDDWLIVAISSEGTVRNGTGDEIKLELAKILRGEYIDKHTSIWHYKLDNVEEVKKPHLWVKASPNIGITVSYETYFRDVERAEMAPAARNDILAKRFGLPMEGYSYYFTYEETKPHARRSFDGMVCSMGMDLSQGDDFTAFTFLFPMTEALFGVKTRSYITDRTYKALPTVLRRKYDLFVAEGALSIMPGTVLDMDLVYDDLEAFIEAHDYDVRCLGYDPYNAKDFIKRWITFNGEFGIEKVIQGFRTESVPLGELKKLSEDRALLFDEQAMVYSMGNAIVIQDTNGNRKLLKRRQDEKIDQVAALMDAWVAFKLYKEAFE